MFILDAGNENSNPWTAEDDDEDPEYIMSAFEDSLCNIMWWFEWKLILFVTEGYQFQLHTIWMIKNYIWITLPHHVSVK